MKLYGSSLRIKAFHLSVCPTTSKGSFSDNKNNGLIIFPPVRLNHVVNHGAETKTDHRYRFESSLIKTVYYRYGLTCVWCGLHSFCVKQANATSVFCYYNVPLFYIPPLKRRKLYESHYFDNSRLHTNEIYATVLKCTGLL